MNRVEIDGRIGKNYGLKYTQSGTALLNFSLAHWNTKNKSPSGEQGVTYWFKITAWADLAQQFSSLNPGDKIEVSGELQQRKWKDKLGQERDGIEIVARAINLLQAAKPKEPKEIPHWSPPVESKEFTEDEIPF